MASTGTAGLVLTGVSIACTITVGAAGTSLMEPPLPGASGSSGASGASGALGQLPWFVDLRPSSYLAFGLAAVGLAAGTLGLALTLRALRAGWRVNPRAILLAGAAAAIVAGTTRPFGSSDFLSYAAYGRELATGHNPYAVAPAALARLGDPVVRAVQDWAGTPSVYGALASGVFGFASLVGGTSARLTVFVLDLVNVVAFVATGLLLDRLARGRLGRDGLGRDRSGEPARGRSMGEPARLRAAVLWTCNPLLLQILVAGGHVDALAVAFGVAGIAMVAPVVAGVAASRAADGAPRAADGAPRAAGGAPSAALFRGVAAGALIGFGFAVKPTVVLIGVGVAIAFASFPAAFGRARGMRYLGTCGLLAGFTVVAATDLVLIGRAGIAQTLRASGMVSVGSPWRVVRTVLSQFMAEPVADEVVRGCAVVFALCLAVALVRVQGNCSAGAGHPRAAVRAGGPSATLAGRAAFALVLAWLVAWPYVLPWYDALAWALLPLLPASGFDWALLARTAVLGFGYLPARSAGITIPSGLRWMEPVIRSAAIPAVLAVVTAFLVFVTLRRAWLPSFYRE